MLRINECQMPFLIVKFLKSADVKAIVADNYGSLAKISRKT